jgi:hypothetical protein
MMTINILLCLFINPIIFHPYSQEVQKGVKFLRSEKVAVLQIKNTSTTVISAEALAVTFPELIRWSAFKDIFETTANEVLYVQKGKETANFSIGHFQMKPNFVEQLEDYVATHPDLATFNYVVIKGKAEKECRKERIERLKQFAWQLRYAHVYWLVAKDKFKNRAFKTATERVRFFATAYNYGFMRPEADIEAWQKKKAFPFGSQYKGEQVAFSDIQISGLSACSSLITTTGGIFIPPSRLPRDVPSVFPKF